MQLGIKANRPKTVPQQRKNNPKPPPPGPGRPKGRKNKGKKNLAVSKGVPSVAEIKFCKLYATGEMSNQDCAKQAGIATGTEQGTAARVRRLLRDPRLRREIDRFRRANMQAARIDSTTLAYDFSQRVRANPCNIYHPVTGEMLPVNEWPKVLQRMVRKLIHDKKTGKLINVEFASTSHLDGILATYTGMIGDRLPADTTVPLTTVIYVERNGPNAPEPLPLPSMEEILGKDFDGDDLGPLLMDIELPDEGEEPPWTPPPEPVPVTITEDDDQTGRPPARPEMHW